MKSMKKLMKSKDLPIYAKTVAHYPHLAHVIYARPFCFALCHLPMLPSDTIADCEAIARVACGGDWDQPDLLKLEEN